LVPRKPHSRRGQTAIGLLETFIDKHIVIDNDITECDANFIALLSDFRDPAALIARREQLDLAEDVEWDDTVSLLNENSTNSRTSNGLLVVPTDLKLTRMSEVAAHSQQLVDSFRRPSEFSPSAKEKVKSYDRTRKTLLNKEWDRRRAKRSSE
jgi:hypothetical protein